MFELYAPLINDMNGVHFYQMGGNKEKEFHQNHRLLNRSTPMQLNSSFLNLNRKFRKKFY